MIVWDLRGERRLGRPFDVGKASGDYFLDATMSPDGRALAMQQDDGTVSLVDLATLRRRTIRIQGIPDQGGTPYAPAFGPHGTLVVSGFSGLLALADKTTGRSEQRLRGHHDIVRTPAASADGNVVASTGEDGTLRFWDTGTDREIGAPIQLEGGAAGNPAISPDGTTAAIPVNTGPVEVFDVRSGKRITRLRIDQSRGTFAGFSRNGRMLLASSAEGRVRLYSAADLHPLGPAFQAEGTSTVDVSPGRPDACDGQLRRPDPAVGRRKPPTDRHRAAGTRARERGGPLRAQRSPRLRCLRQRPRLPLGRAPLLLGAPRLHGGRPPPHAGRVARRPSRSRLRARLLNDAAGPRHMP